MKLNKSIFLFILGFCLITVCGCGNEKKEIDTNINGLQIENYTFQGEKRIFKV